MANVTLNQVIKEFQTIAENHKQINSFGFGDIWEIATSGDIKYSMMWVVLEEPEITGSVDNLKFKLIFMDLVKGGEVNENEVLSDQLEIAKDVIAQLQHPSYPWEFDNTRIILEPFTERFNDSVSGFTCSVTLMLPFAFDRCAIPMDSFSINDLACPVVTIYDSDGNVVTTVAAGGSYTIDSAMCDDATVKNSDNSYSATVASGGTLTLPDETIRVYVNGALNQTGTYVPLSGQTINISG